MVQAGPDDARLDQIGQTEPNDLSDDLANDQQGGQMVTPHPTSAPPPIP